MNVGIVGSPGAVYKFYTKLSKGFNFNNTTWYLIPVKFILERENTLNK